MAKYIVVCGGAVSGVGKGVAACSIGLLLKLRNLKIQYIKFDPYLSLNSGIQNPTLHGESYVCADGTECDLDVGHCYRFFNLGVGRNNITTSGLLHKELIQEQEDGKYMGVCVQIVPHMTDKVQERLYSLGKDSDVVICEIGGSSSDWEGHYFYEAIRQFKQKHKDDVLVVMVAPILWISTIKEFKTKPLQNSVQDLQSFGLQPDVLLCRVDRPVPSEILDKVSSLTNVPRHQVFDAPDAESIYDVPMEFYERNLDDLFVDMFRFPRSSCRISNYRKLVERIHSAEHSVNIGIVGKYDLEDAYLSIKESLVHSGAENNVKVNIKWIQAEALEKEGFDFKELFSDLNGVIIPGGFDKRGVLGKIKAIQFARESKTPILGICLGVQCMAIEYARNVCNIQNANSTEFDPATDHPIIHHVVGQKELKTKSANMRLGNYACAIEPDSIAFKLYGSKLIHERHRHRYEVNPDYIEQISNSGFKVSGRNPETNLVEIMEMHDHPYFIGCQFHPEFLSRLESSHPLFSGLVRAALENKKSSSK